MWRVSLSGSGSGRVQYWLSVGLVLGIGIFWARLGEVVLLGEHLRKKGLDNLTGVSVVVGGMIVDDRCLIGRKVDADGSHF